MNWYLTFALQNGTENLYSIAYVYCGSRAIARIAGEAIDASIGGAKSYDLGAKECVGMPEGIAKSTLNLAGGEEAYAVDLTWLISEQIEMLKVAGLLEDIDDGYWFSAEPKEKDAIFLESTLEGKMRLIRELEDKIKGIPMK